MLPVELFLNFMFRKYWYNIDSASILGSTLGNVTVSHITETLGGIVNEIVPKITTFASRRVITQGLDENYTRIRLLCNDLDFLSNSDKKSTMRHF